MIIRNYINLLFIPMGMACILLSGCSKDDDMKQPLPPDKTFRAEATLNDTALWKANSVWSIISKDKQTYFWPFGEQSSYLYSGDDKTTIHFGYFINKYCLIERISFRNIPISIDSFNLRHIRRSSAGGSRQPTAHYSAVDCDATGEEYNLLETDGTINQIVIEKINKYEDVNTVYTNFDENIVELVGSFQMTLVRNNSIPKIIFPNRPDTLRLTDGTFNAIILRKE